MDRRTAGALTMLAASLAFAGMGLLVKAVSGALPTGEIVAWRTTVTALVLLGAAAAQGSTGLGALRPVNVRMHLVRGAVGMASMVLYFHAIARLPLGDAVLLTYLSPMLVALLSPWTTGERPSGRVWLALLVGLPGVALVAGPTGSLDPWGVAAGLGAAFFAAEAYLSVRVLTRTDARSAIVFWFSAVGALLSTPAWLDGATLPSALQLAQLVAIGITGAVAQHLLTLAYSYAEAAEIAVYSYATPVFAYALGLLVLREVPAPGSLLGAALVVAAGAIVSRGGAAPVSAAPPPPPGSPDPPEARGAGRPSPSSSPPAGAEAGPRPSRP